MSAPRRILLTAGFLLITILFPSVPALAGYEFPICTQRGYQAAPDISGNIVVWYDWREYPTEGSDPDIYGYDLSTYTEFPVCTAPGTQSSPAVSGNIVVWEDARDYSATGWDIYGYDLSTHEEFGICTAPGNQEFPAVDGSIVVWQDGRNDAMRTDIYGYNLSTHVEFPVCTAPGSQISPDISGNIVVWSADGENIYGCDLSTALEFPICLTPLAQTAPAISGALVVWQDCRNGATWSPSPYEPPASLPDIYARDLSTSAEFPIVTLYIGQYNPAVSNNIVAWEDYRNAGLACEHFFCWFDRLDIYAYDLSSGLEFRVSTQGPGGSSPAVSGNIIVWSNGDIWGYVIDGQVPPGPLPAPSALRARAVTRNRVDLTWADNSTDETGFRIERKYGADGAYEQIKIVSPNTTTFSDNYVYSGRYCYRVRAYRGADIHSEYSNEASVTIPVFEDVPVTASYCDYVQALWENRITVGCSWSPLWYCPDSHVTRAQMAVFLCRAAGKGPLNRETPTFCDVPKTNPYYGWIERIADPDSWNGNPPTIGCTWFPCKKYCPSNPVLRDEMAAFLVRATGKPPISSCSGMFADVGTYWACPYIERVADPASWPGGVAVTSGCAVNPLRYCPKDPLTRGHMAVFLVRAFGIPL